MGSGKAKGGEILQSEFGGPIEGDEFFIANEREVQLTRDEV